jgi:hypothetical protein
LFGVDVALFHCGDLVGVIISVHKLLLFQYLGTGWTSYIDARDSKVTEGKMSLSNLHVLYTNFCTTNIAGL